MEENSNQRLHSVVLTESNNSDDSNHSIKLSESNKNTNFICCFSHKWCFDHTTPAAYGKYDENQQLCCVCFDLCAWCLEFQHNKCFCCKKNTICFMCCCTFRFE